MSMYSELAPVMRGIVEPRTKPATLAERVPSLRYLEQLLVDAKVYRWGHDRAGAIRDGRLAIDAFSGGVDLAAAELGAIADAGAADQGDVSALINHLCDVVH